MILQFKVVHPKLTASILLNFPPFPGKMLWNGYTSGLCPGKTYFPDPLNPERIKIYWVLLLIELFRFGYSIMYQYNALIW